jgi:uncharacterized lipoprotein YddW (UPF0748 family)
MTHPFLRFTAAATALAVLSFGTPGGRADAASARWRITFDQVVPVDRVDRVDSLPPLIARELRGAWVSPLDAMTGADWPSRMGLSPEDQRAQLRILFDHARSIGLNAIVLHVRTEGDALYASHLVPWSVFLSGKSGVGPNPEYDPLAFAVAEAHARGMQLHAWFNPFRAMLPNSTSRMAANHVTRAHKSWIRKYGAQTWIDPGEPAARTAVLAEILDVVDRYDIDAIHLDDYFYPYRERKIVTKSINGHRVRVNEDVQFPDATTWKKYGAKTFRNRDDWRRANIDTFVTQLYTGVKQRKPWVMVGISPFGIWRSGTPAGVTGLDAYTEIYADARLWLREGWVDYMSPQLYWPLNGVEGRFTALDDWWRSENPKDRAIWPGLFDASVAVRRAGWTGDEIPAEIERLRYSRELGHDSNGHIHFRLGAMLMNGRAIGERLRTQSYAEPALVPPTPWLGGAPPGDPKVTSVKGTALDVAPGDNVPVAWWMIQTRMSDGRWRYTLRRATERHIDLATLGDLGGRRVAVTAVDRVGQLSGAVVLDLE